MTVRLAIVTPNPAVDVTYRVATTRPGHTHRVSQALRRAGGKGVNVARVSRLLGASTTTVLPLGGAAGEWIAGQLSAEGDEPLVCEVGAETRTTVTTVDDAGRATVYTESGHPLPDEDWTRFDKLVAEAAEHADALVISGSMPPSTGAEHVTAWVAAAAARGIPSIVDTAGAGLLAAAAAGASVLKPNDAELTASIGGRSVNQRMARLLGLGAGLVVVTRGARGVIAADGTGTWRVGAIDAITGNPTGAGDAATAAFTLAHVRGEPIATRLRWANAAGAAAVLAPGAGELDPETFQRLLEPGRQP